MPGEIRVRKEHPQSGCHLGFALLPRSAAGGAAWAGGEDGDPPQQGKRSLVCRVAQGVRTCFKAEQRPESSQMILAPFWAAEMEELLRGFLDWRPAQVL